MELTPQVIDFVRRLPPDARKRVRQALRDLQDEKGDIKRLEAPLAEYCRLRVDGYRVLFTYAKRQTIACVFVERRSIVYEVFAALVADKLL